MRQFVVVAHEAPTDPGFALDDLPGAGRVDLLARCVNAACLLSHGIRRDVRVWLVVRDAITIRFDASGLRNAGPDERTTAGLIAAALDASSEAIGHQAVESTPGVRVSKRDLAATLDEAGGTLVWLHADGKPASTAEPPGDPVFVLSDHREFTGEEARLLRERADRRVSLGPEALHADHAVVVAHNYLDTDGWSQY